jgi:hypothetical protein
MQETQLFTYKEIGKTKKSNANNTIMKSYENHLSNLIDMIFLISLIKPIFELIFFIKSNNPYNFQLLKTKSTE